MNWRVRIVACWIVALVVHHAVVRPGPTAPDPEMRVTRIGSGDTAVDIARFDDRPDRREVLLLVHGSPGSARNFDQLRAALPGDLRVIAPDLPGFGSSTRQLDDYSFTRHAGDLLALLDALAIERVHAAGMSMGGGVVLEMARLDPARVASLTLISSIGLQGYELTGDYWTNHVLHGAQVALVWVVDHLVPHFGLLSSGGQARSYARNFFDSDQRRLEPTLRRWSGPVLVVHGDRDFLVPVGAARAHARAMPQAVVREYASASHFLIWTQPDAVARDIASFVGSVGEREEAFAAEPRPLPTASPLAGPGRWMALGLAAVVALFAFPLAAWWFLPMAGAADGIALAAALLAGALAGGTLRARRRGARPLRGAPGLAGRAVLYLGALSGLGAVVPLRSGQGFVFALVLWILLGLARAAWRRPGRARLRGGWLRLRRWEYWPGWAVYLPVVPRLWWRARGYGGLRTASCVNPAIPLGGFVGESKSRILSLLRERDEVARWTLVLPGTPEERHGQVRQFAAGLDQPWPIVLKPDRGERGTGVCIARTPGEVAVALRAIEIPIVAQEYVPGVEYGVFWWRGPADDRGRVFSVAHKAMVSVTGDGRSRLEELLFADDRVLPFLDLHLAKFAGRLDEVVPAGEEVQVTELGTHALGATFLDARHLASDNLAASLDRIMHGTGLDFGRFDLRVPAAQDLPAGRHLKILEFNGLSAEAAHVYDPENRLGTARADLLRQWTAALEIGAANRRNGRRPAGWLEVARTARRHFADHAARGGGLRNGG